jgi:20S proteasome alpha/beta subunit
MHAKPFKLYILTERRERTCRRMTLIIGMVCHDCLLFCADREENTEGFGKRSVSKIHQTSGTNWDMVIATSGHGPLADVAAERIITAAKQTADFHVNPQSKIEETLSKVYEEYVFSRDEHRQRQRDISLVIGITEEENGRRFLFKTYEDIVKPEGHYACAGAGADLAYYFLDYFLGDGFSGSDAQVFTAFILREAKSTVGNVGLGSEFVTVQFHGPYKGMSNRTLVGEAVDWQHIPRFNQCFAPFWKDNPHVHTVTPSTDRKLRPKK